MFKYGPLSSLSHFLALCLVCLILMITYMRWHHVLQPTEVVPAASIEPVLISTHTPHYFGRDFERSIPGCAVPCTFRAVPSSKRATAIWYHAPHACSLKPQRAFPKQIAIIASMESSAYYRCLDDALFMSRFNITTTYRLSSDIPTPYLRPDHIDNFARPLVPFAEKSNAIVYIQSNCDALSKRDDILKKLQEQGIKLDARGRCLNNAPAHSRAVSKQDTMKQYKICVTFENSLASDYVSEKLWDGMSAGCLPIYYGAPNIAEHLPMPNAVIDYQALGASPEKLAIEIRRLQSNETAYNETMTWRSMPLESLGSGYQKLVALSKLEHTQCRLCKLVAKLRDEQDKLPMPYPQIDSSRITDGNG
jgi:alpha-1,3-fucosyltransferase 10